MQISVRQFNIMTDIILKHKKVDDETGTCSDKAYTNASKGGSTSRPPQPLNGRVLRKVCNFSYILIWHFFKNSGKNRIKN